MLGTRLSPRRWVSCAFLCPSHALLSCIIPLHVSSQLVGTCNFWMDIVKQIFKNSEFCLILELTKFPVAPAHSQKSSAGQLKHSRVPAMGLGSFLGSIRSLEDAEIKTRHSLRACPLRSLPLNLLSNTSQWCFLSPLVDQKFNCSLLNDDSFVLC